jgi:hypothetical protein
MFLEEGTTVAISTADAERLAKELYGIGATATELPGEYDCNFHLHARDGREFVMKCMHPARENSFIDMQCAALAHLATNAPRLPLPRVQLTKRASLDFDRGCGSANAGYGCQNFLPRNAPAADVHSPEFLTWEDSQGEMDGGPSALFIRQRNAKWRDVSRAN